MSLVAPAVKLRLKSVLIATDFSEASEKPLCHALAIARPYRAKFYLAHVVSSLGYTIGGPDAVIVAAVRKHGEGSRQAEQRRHEIEEVRERCHWRDHDHDRR